jgi:hypothetical protein
MVIYLWRGVRAEFLKIKRSQVLFVALLIPLFPAGLNFGEVLQRGLHVLESDTPGRLSPWSMYFRSSIDYWTIFALPLVVAVLSTLLANVDHQNHQWKELFSLAFPRTGVFAGKWTALMALCALSSIAFGIANILGGLAAGFLRPDLGLSLATLPWIEAFSRPLLGWLLSSSMITIQLWISLHWSQFLVSILSGFLEVLSTCSLSAHSCCRCGLRPVEYAFQYLHRRLAVHIDAIPVLYHFGISACQRRVHSQRRVLVKTEKQAICYRRWLVQFYGVLAVERFRFTSGSS